MSRPRLLAAVEGPHLLAAAAMLLSSVAVYLPLLGALDKVCRYWDGPAYLYVAKSLYVVPADHPFTPYELPPAYFANHLPLYPLLVRGLMLASLGDGQAALILATLLSSTAAAALLLELFRREGLVASPLWSVVLFCLLPPRWLLYHAVGATEPLFLCCVFAALLALGSGRSGWVVVWTGLAALTRITGVLLVPAFFLYHLERREWRRAALMPAALLGLLALFGYYRLVFGDFWAYFTWNLDSAGIVSLRPLEIFRRYATADKFHSAELYAILYVGYAVGTLALWRRRALFWYCAVYLVFCGFISHHDLPRYLVPIAPFALLVAFDPLLAGRRAWLALPLLLYVDYTAAWGHLPQKLVSRAVYERVLASPAQPFGRIR